ncbi:MAG: SDR family NAD(P)-dependent oxidoreductase [Planctomycetes bacterium]|nr:SDR family NAD(P)-dependent oxidoreductase [Planctomycetota bacterium]
MLVTGASTGLGLALVRRLVQTEHRLVLTSRKESLARFAQAGITENERIRIRALDVTVLEQRLGLVEELERELGGVDVLVNNAGAMYRAVLEHLSDIEQFVQLDVNYLAPMDLARLVLPHMRAQRFGKILNVSSVGGMMAMPTMAGYSASKWALEGATEALYYEVKPWNIDVTLVEPGFVRSDSYRNVRFTDQSSRSRDDVHEAYHAHYEEMGPFIARMMKLARATPDHVARKIVRVLHQRHPPLRAPATLDAYLFSGMRRFLPRRVYHWLLYRTLPNVTRWGVEE